MSDHAPGVSGLAAELARTFDETFAQSFTRGTSAIEADADVENLLGLRVAGEDYAVRLAGVKGLLPAQKIVPLPTAVPELLGLIGLRGDLVPIYGLAALLGHAPAAEPPTWVILVGEAAFGLAFDQFSGYLRLRRADVAGIADPTPTRAPRAMRAHVSETARVAGALRGLVDLSSVARAVTERSTAVGQKGKTHVDVR